MALDVAAAHEVGEGVADLVLPGGGHLVHVAEVVGGGDVLGLGMPPMGLGWEVDGVAEGDVGHVAEAVVAQVEVGALDGAADLEEQGHVAA